MPFFRTSLMTMTDHDTDWREHLDLLLSNASAGQRTDSRLLRAQSIPVSLESLALALLQRTRPTCRFCNGAERPDLMLAPCSCTEPPLRWAHGTCLEEYVNRRDAVTCRFCLHRFPVRRRPLPMMEYLRQRTSRFHELYLLVVLLFCTSLYWVLGTAWVYAAGRLRLHWLLAAIVYTPLCLQTASWSIFGLFSIWYYFRMAHRWRYQNGTYVLGDITGRRWPPLQPRRTYSAP